MRFVCVDGGGLPGTRKVMARINSLSSNCSSIPKATTAADDGGRRSYLLSLSIYHLPTPPPPPNHPSIHPSNHKSQIKNSQITTPSTTVPQNQEGGARTWHDIIWIDAMSV